MGTKSIDQLRKELAYYKNFKRKHDKDLMKLIGSPSWKKYVEGSTIHGNGCVLHDWKNEILFDN
jgi:hypothetical protein